MALTDTDNPDVTSVSIRLPAADVEYQHFLAYEYDEHFLTPSDAWWFDLDQDELTPAQIAALEPGQRVDVSVSGLAQSRGYIDTVNIRAGSGGTVIHVEGRDWLSPSVDAQIDPRTQFNATMTILQVVQAVFAPFGIQAVLGDNIANVTAMTGAIYGTRTSPTGKALQNTLKHQLKPYPREGAFGFAARVCQREGLWIWPSSTFGTVIIGQPNFTQAPIYQLQHSTSSPSANNVLDSSVTYSRQDQPSVILASGIGGGGDFSKAALRCAVLNPFVTVPEGQISAALAAYPGVVFTDVTPGTIYGSTFVDPIARPLYLYDPESHVKEELTAFARREMSLKMRQSFQMHYTIEGHRLGGNPIAVDTMMAINDDRSNLHTTGYVLSRNFSKSAGGGTKTKMELIRPFSLQF